MESNLYVLEWIFICLVCAILCHCHGHSSACHCAKEDITIIFEQVTSGLYIFFKSIIFIWSSMELVHQFLCAGLPHLEQRITAQWWWGNPGDTGGALCKQHYTTAVYYTTHQSTQGLVVFGLFVCWVLRVIGWTQGTWRLHGVIELNALFRRKKREMELYY